jgi:hypothetical protein
VSAKEVATIPTNRAQNNDNSQHEELQEAIMIPLEVGIKPDRLT